MEEVFAHINISNVKVCLICEALCAAERKHCPSCTSAKLVGISQLKRVILDWAGLQETT